MDEFDQAEACGEGDDRSEVASRLFASERDAFEALEASDALLDARARLIEGACEESWFVALAGFVRDDGSNATRPCRLAIGLAGVTFVADDGAGLNVGANIEQDVEMTRVGGFAACVDFPGEAAARATERLPFLSPFAPAADTCARTIVESNSSLLGMLI